MDQAELGQAPQLDQVDTHFAGQLVAGCAWPTGAGAARRGVGKRFLLGMKVASEPDGKGILATFTAAIPTPYMNS